MTDHSIVGKRSRRKGKAFEQTMARQFKEWFGHEWMTSRNSGRTDIPGDIFCKDRPTNIMVECKHRKTWTIDQWVKGTVAYTKNLYQVIDRWVEERDEYPILWVFSKNEHGLWIMERFNDDEFVNETLEQVFVYDTAISTEHGCWYRVVGVKGSFSESTIYRTR